MSFLPIYGLRVSEVFQSLESSLKGLSETEAQARLSLYGENILTEQESSRGWRRYIRQVRHPFIILMLLAILISIWQKELSLALTILSLTILNSGFSFWREYRAGKATEKLRHLLPAYAHLIREGEECHIPADRVVPGDVLVLAEGDNIPADARVVEEYGLRVNNAALTGEAIAARKIADASSLAGISELERPNLIFAGTSVASGTGKAVVYATGMLTQFGRIAHLTQSVQETPSSFEKELSRLGKVLTWLAIGVAGLVWLLVTQDPNLNHHYGKPLLLALGVLVAVTPEGLPATLTLSLAMAVQRLTGHGVLVKKLSTIETLGNVSVICTDKSGTLTQNQMTVRDIWVYGTRIHVTGVGYEPKGEFRPPPKTVHADTDLNALLEAAYACNNARISPPTLGHPTWSSLGDQTEAALKVVSMKYGLEEDIINLLYPRIHEIPFDARRKRMTTIHRTTSGDVAFVKGAPREILQLCGYINHDGKRLVMDQAVRDNIIAVHDEYARRALRVLAVARRDLPDRSGPYSPDNIEQNLTFLGLIGMMDPPRPEVERAIGICREAGIRIVMITGDYGLTAESLARRVGMITTANPLIITGAQLDEMSDTVLQQSLEKEVIFSRMAPDHKMRLVSTFQERGDVVVVTGDGVNDAPALRKADVGVAMGLVGTDVAKESADVILTGDDFGAIVSAVKEGRAIYDNIRKFITYIFTSNVPEILPFLITSITGIPPALSVRQILAIDMGMDILPALALGTENPEPDIMQHPPRPRSLPLLDRGLLLRAFGWLGIIESVLCYLSFLATYLFSGNVDQLGLPFLTQVPFPRLFNISGNINTVASTVFFAAVAMSQIGNAFACRTSRTRNTQIGWTSNLNLMGSIVLVIVAVLALIYVPALSRGFDNQPIPWFFWLILPLNALILYGLEWVRKGIIRGIDQLRDKRTQYKQGGVP